MLLLNYLNVRLFGTFFHLKTKFEDSMNVNIDLTRKRIVLYISYTRLEINLMNLFMSFHLSYFCFC